MNTKPEFSKRCSRCPLIVRMTREQFEKEKGQTETTCERCRAILTADVREILNNAELVNPPAQTIPEKSTD